MEVLILNRRADMEGEIYTLISNTWFGAPNEGHIISNYAVLITCQNRCLSVVCGKLQI
jgi:hypothetical protein